MKNKTLFALVIFVVSVFPHLVVQRALAEKMEDDLALEQSTSPMMMFGGDEDEVPALTTTDPRSTASRDVSPRGAASADSSSDTVRGTSSQLAEEGEDEGALTLDHFRASLAQNPTARRFVILEDEESGISIESRAAGTSRLALKKNQGENETIIDELRALLITRHRGASETVASFFDGVISSGDTALSAERLQEILRRSDVAQKPIASKKSAAQKTPPPSASESEVTSALDDSNVDEFLDAETQGSLLTAAKASIAISTLEKSDQAVSDFKKLQKDKKAAMRQRREQKVLASALESETEGYMTPGTFLVHDALKTAQLTAATLRWNDSNSLLESKKISTPERDVEDFTHIAEGERTQARKASLLASNAKKKNKATSDKNNLDQEYIVSSSAKEAWINTEAAYQAAIKKATKVSFETRELAIACDEAKANSIYWHGSIFEVNAKKIERSLAEMSHAELAQAREIQSLWDEALKHYQQAISRVQAVGVTDELEEWMADVAKAQTQKESWSIKVVEAHTEESRRNLLRELQAEAYNKEKEAAAAEKRASNALDTLESLHWHDVLQEASEAESFWHRAILACEESLNEAPARFKAQWQAELQKATEDKDAWASNIVSLLSQKNESIARAQAQRRAQQGLDEKADVARYKVTEATTRVDEAQSRLASARQVMQQAAVLADATAAKIVERQSIFAGLVAEFQRVNERIRDAQARAEKQKYSFRNAVGISHSRQTAIEDERQAKMEAATLSPALEQAELDLAQVRKDDITTRAEAERAEALFNQLQAEVAQATRALAPLKKEAAEAIRWAALTPAQRVDEGIAEEARAKVEAEAKQAAAKAEVQAKREAASKKAHDVWSTLVNERSAVTEKHRLATVAADHSFSAVNASNHAVSVYLTVKASIPREQIIDHPTNHAATAALDSSATAAFNLFNASKTYASAVEHFLATMRESAAFDLEAGVHLEQWWTNAMSAVEQERNAWNSMTGTSIWKNLADLIREYSIHWSNVRDASRRWYQVATGSAEEAAINKNIDFFSAGLSRAGAGKYSAGLSGREQLAAAQEATQAANQAFQNLKLARDAATVKR